jgi:hypothetical protein
LLSVAALALIGAFGATAEANPQVVRQTTVVRTRVVRAPVVLRTTLRAPVVRRPVVRTAVRTRVVRNVWVNRFIPHGRVVHRR